MQFEEGKIYKEFISLREKISFDFDGQKGKIVLLKKYPKPEEIEHIKECDAFFQIFLKEGIIFLLIKFGELKWLDIPFVLHHKVENLKLPENDCGYGVEILIADANTGKLLINKFVNLTNGLSKALFWAIKKQLEEPPKDIVRKVNKVHAAFSSDEMARLSLGR